MRPTQGFFRRLLLIVAGVVLAVTGARADSIVFTLTLPAANANPGDTVTFDATLLAPDDNWDAIYLNWDQISIDSPLTMDDSPFFANFPLYMNPGDGVTSTLFTVFVPLGTAGGVYAGYFEIDGGADTDALDNLASTLFSVNVAETGQQEAAPEPLSLLLVGCGLLALGRMRRKR